MTSIHDDIKACMLRILRAAGQDGLTAALLKTEALARYPSASQRAIDRAFKSLLTNTEIRTRGSTRTRTYYTTSTDPEDAAALRASALEINAFRPLRNHLRGGPLAHRHTPEWLRKIEEREK